MKAKSSNTKRSQTAARCRRTTSKFTTELGCRANAFSVARLHLQTAIRLRNGAAGIDVARSGLVDRFDIADAAFAELGAAQAATAGAAAESRRDSRSLGEVEQRSRRRRPHRFHIAARECDVELCRRIGSGIAARRQQC